MALIQCHFFSDVLGLSTSMTVILPQKTSGQIGMGGRAGGGKHPTLYLLHGLSDDDSIWVRRTSLERYVAELGLAVVMPNVHRSFYADMEYGGCYWTFLAEELPAVAASFFPLSDTREDNFVAGLSMGGYGAFKWALRCPERFAKAVSLSGVTDIAGHIEQADPASPIRQVAGLVFGDRPIRGTPDDLIWLMEQGLASGAPLPELYQICGTEDFLYRENVTFREACRTAKYPAYVYEEGPGDHSWAFWDEYIQKALAFFFPDK